MLIAWKNIMARKWSSTKVALSILAMVIIMCIFTAYSIALGEETERITKSYRSAHNVIIETTTPIDSKKVEQAKNIEGIGNVAEILVCRNTKNLRGMSFVIGGKEYSCNQGNHRQVKGFSVLITVFQYHMKPLTELFLMPCLCKAAAVPLYQVWLILLFKDI